MALFDLGPLVNEISGSIGGTTFARSNAGGAARRRAGPCNSGTAAELAARNTQVYLAKQWTLLSQTDQALWNLAGQAHPLPNHLGRYRTISGFALWMQVGTNLVNAGQTLNSAPPSSWTTPPVTNPSVTVTLAPTSTTQFTMSWSRQTAIASVLSIKATGPTPWGKRPKRDQLRAIANIAPSTNPPILLVDQWSAVYGLPPQSTPYQILWEVTPYQRSTGAQGPWVDFVLSVGGPNPAPPPTPGTTPATAAAIAESLTNAYTGSTTDPAWLTLVTGTNVTYTVVWTSADVTAAPIIASGPSPTSLTTLHDFAETDAYTFTATAGLTYYLGMNPWAAATPWQVAYAPSQVENFQFAYLTGTWRKPVLIAEGTNQRLVSDVQYQGP